MSAIENKRTKQAEESDMQTPQDQTADTLRKQNKQIEETMSTPVASNPNSPKALAKATVPDMAQIAADQHAGSVPNGSSAFGSKDASYNPLINFLMPKCAQFNPGGLAEKEPTKAIDRLEKHPEQVHKGIPVEKEHTSSTDKALKIVADHLVEDPTYYNHLKAMEKAVDEKKSVPKTVKAAMVKFAKPGDPGSSGAGLGSAKPPAAPPIPTPAKITPGTGTGPKPPTVPAAPQPESTTTTPSAQPAATAPAATAGVSQADLLNRPMPASYNITAPPGNTEMVSSQAPAATAPASTTATAAAPAKPNPAPAYAQATGTNYERSAQPGNTGEANIGAADRPAGAGANAPGIKPQIQGAIDPSTGLRHTGISLGGQEIMGKGDRYGLDQTSYDTAAAARDKQLADPKSMLAQQQPGAQSQATQQPAQVAQAPAANSVETPQEATNRIDSAARVPATSGAINRESPANTAARHTSQGDSGFVTSNENQPANMGGKIAMYYKQAEEQTVGHIGTSIDSIKPATQDAIMDFVKNNPNLDDEKLHEFVQNHGIDREDAERLISSRYGKDIQKQAAVQQAFTKGVLSLCKEAGITAKSTCTVLDVVARMVPEFEGSLKAASAYIQKIAWVMPEGAGKHAAGTPADPQPKNMQPAAGTVDSMTGSAAHRFMTGMAANRLKARGKSKNGVAPHPDDIFKSLGNQMAIRSVAAGGAQGGGLGE